MSDGLLRNFWYLALRGDKLRPGKTRPIKLLGEALVVGRRKSGEVFAFGDQCPHRGMPLRHACFADNALREVKSVPDGYLAVSSGVGRHAPTTLLLSPSRDDEAPNGLLELGFFRPVTPLDRELLELLSPVVGTVVTSTFRLMTAGVPFVRTCASVTTQDPWSR